MIFCKYKHNHEFFLYLSHYEKLSLREPCCLATRCQIDVQCNWCAIMLHLFHGNKIHLKIKRHAKFQYNCKNDLYIVGTCLVYTKKLVNVFQLYLQVAQKLL
jgi:hypothetical protein